MQPSVQPTPYQRSRVSLWWLFLLLALYGTATANAVGVSGLTAWGRALTVLGVAIFAFQYLSYATVFVLSRRTVALLVFLATILTSSLASLLALEGAPWLAIEILPLLVFVIIATWRLYLQHGGAPANPTNPISLVLLILVISLTYCVFGDWGAYPFAKHLTATVNALLIERVPVSLLDLRIILLVVSIALLIFELVLLASPRIPLTAYRLYVPPALPDPPAISDSSLFTFLVSVLVESIRYLVQFLGWFSARVRVGVINTSHTLWMFLRAAVAAFAFAGTTLWSKYRAQYAIPYATYSGVIVLAWLAASALDSLGGIAGLVTFSATRAPSLDGLKGTVFLDVGMLGLGMLLGMTEGQSLRAAASAARNCIQVSARLFPARGFATAAFSVILIWMNDGYCQIGPVVMFCILLVTGVWLLLLVEALGNLPWLTHLGAFVAKARQFLPQNTFLAVVVLVLVFSVGLVPGIGSAELGGVKVCSVSISMH